MERELKLALMNGGVHPDVIERWVPQLQIKDGKVNNPAMQAAMTVQPGQVLLYGPIVSSVMEALISSWLGPDLVVSSQSFMRRLQEARDSGDGKHVEMLINSPGGSVFEASAIYSRLNKFRKEEDGEVKACVDGIAASAASFVMLASDAVESSETGMVFIHNSRGVAIGTHKQISQQAILLAKIDKTIQAVYVSKAPGLEKKLTGLMEAETWFTASEAVEAGLVDAVVNRKKEDGSEVDAGISLADVAKMNQEYDNELEGILGLT